MREAILGAMIRAEAIVMRECVVWGRERRMTREKTWKEKDGCGEEISGVVEEETTNGTEGRTRSERGREMGARNFQASLV